MIFRIRRTSDHYGFLPPTERAYRMTWPVWDVRNCSEDHFNLHRAERESKWLDEGTNHHIDSLGNIKRQLGEEEGWAIEINSLFDLLLLIKGVGKVVLFEDLIEIYDEDRE